jgi:hypothetical protein
MAFFITRNKVDEGLQDNVSLRTVSLLTYSCTKYGLYLTFNGYKNENSPCLISWNQTNPTTKYKKSYFINKIYNFWI